MMVMKISDFLSGIGSVGRGRFEAPVTTDAISPARRTFVEVARVPTGVGMTCSMGSSSPAA